MISREAAHRATKKANEISEEMQIEARLQAGYTRVDPIAIAEGAGIFVIARPMDNLLGAFIREDRVGIVLNTGRSAGMFHLTCAHELGHFYLGHGTTADVEANFDASDSSMELEANQFAYSLMSSVRIVANVLRGQGWNWSVVATPAKLYQLSLRLGLSYKATIWSLVRLKKLDAGIASSFAKIAPAEIKRLFVPPGIRLSSTQDVWHLGPRDKDFILEPRPTDCMVIDLPSHVSAGYLWSVNDAASIGYTLRPVYIDRSQASPGENATTQKMIVGGQEVLRFEIEPDAEILAQSFDEVVTFGFKETQPWVNSIDERAEFSLHAKVEVIESGLVRASRERLLNEMADE